MNLVRSTLSKLSRLKTSSADLPSTEALEGHLYAQSLAYQCAVQISKELKEGWTEKQTATLMDTFLRDHGVKSFFHRSFAWFGDHTRFDGYKHYWDFLPSSRPLMPQDVVILDTAPIVHGYVGDIGYTLSLHEHAELLEAKKFLKELRELIPSLFMSSMKTNQIWKKIDLLIKAKGYDNCHSLYPFAVLGHRVHHVPLSRLPGITIPFGLHAYWALVSRGLFPELLSPEHEGIKDGLWAIEPHLGGEGFGAKFEEILVVEEGRAHWLSDDVPHMKEALR